jgi:hypothetical protein
MTEALWFISVQGKSFSVVQGLAEKPDDFATQLSVEPLMWGSCP